MKTEIKPYTQSLLKQNFPYLFICVFFTLLALGGPFFMLKKLSENKTKISDLQEEIKTLHTRKTIVDTLANQNGESLQTNLNVLNTLVPDTEDYFSIIDSLEALSQKTNFHILSYSINPVVGEAPERLPIDILGVGDTQAFIDFLNTYNFGGNRLITLDKVQFKPAAGESSYQLSINFYHSKLGNQPSTDIDYRQSLAKLEKFKKEVNITIHPQTNSLNTSYPVKSNPF